MTTPRPDEITTEDPTQAAEWFRFMRERFTQMSASRHAIVVELLKISDADDRAIVLEDVKRDLESSSGGPLSVCTVRVAPQPTPDLPASDWRDTAGLEGAKGQPTGK